MRKLTIFIIFIFILISCKSQPLGMFPSVKIIEPEFDVVSIYIIQADLVVTEFEAVIRINNPNDFAVELSSITYELFGNSRFWAGGIAKDVFLVPANTSGETRFNFSMNFINMNRALLDDVIAMRQVNYRFKGQANVRPVIRSSSPFNVDFDCSGYSEVKRKAD
ncbi:MAG: LEA type 2 family protein [Treponema sp.]|nr:LEA type 2 family protein [Treponema sp.]